MEYLTESSLGLFLNDYFKCGEWIHDKCFVSRNRSDYRNDSYKLIVEFDGEKHYTVASRILKDIENEKIYLNNGFKVIRIPYFVQLDKYVIEKLFGVNINVDNHYPHGFVDKKCVLPSDFCELGIRRFEEDLIKFSELKDEIIQTLKNKILILKDELMVIPNSLKYLIELQ